MKNIYKIIEQSIYTKEFTETDIVKCSSNEIKELCDDMNKFHKNNLKNFFSYMPAIIEVLDEEGNLYKVTPTSFKDSHVNISENKYELIQDSLEGITNKIDTINNNPHSDVYYEFEEAKVLTVEQAWKNYENRLKKLGYKVPEIQKYNNQAQKDL